MEIIDYMNTMPICICVTSKTRSIYVFYPESIDENWINLIDGILQPNKLRVHEPLL